MMNRNVRYTVQDYMNLPESEEKRHELLEGEIYVVPSPNTIHQAIVRKISRAFEDYVLSRGMGTIFFAPLDVVLSNEDVVQPDILFVSTERTSIITEQNIQGAPDIVLEVLSRATASRDRTLKRARYARFGVREYWIVDPQTKTIEILTASETGFDTYRVFPIGTAASSPLMAELAMQTSAIFS